MLRDTKTTNKTKYFLPKDPYALVVSSLSKKSFKHTGHSFLGALIMARERQFNPALDALMTGSVSFQRAYLKFGGPNVALMLSQACYWQTVKGLGLEWYKSEEEWLSECGLTRRMVETARGILVSLGILKYTLKGCPRKGYYMVDTDRLCEKLCDANTTETGAASFTNPPCCIGGNVHAVLAESAMLITETTTETTTDKKDVSVERDINKGKVKEIPPSPQRGAATASRGVSSSEQSLLQDDEAPTQERISALKRAELDRELLATFNLIHQIAGLSKPVTMNKSDKKLLSDAIKQGVTAERIGNAWKRALASSDARYWPFHCVIEKLPTLEAEPPKQSKAKGQLSQDEIEAAARKAWANAFGGALVCDKK